MSTSYPPPRDHDWKRIKLIDEGSIRMLLWEARRRYQTEEDQIRELATRVLPHECCYGDDRPPPDLSQIALWLVEDIENLRTKVEGMERAATLNRARHLAKHGHDR